MDSLEHYYVVRYKRIDRATDTWCVLDERHHSTKEGAINELKRVFFGMLENRTIYLAEVNSVNVSNHLVDLTEERQRWRDEEKPRP